VREFYSDAYTLAVRNLVENAIQHTPCGGHVEITVEDGPVLRVQDTGPGVAPAARQAVFDRCWQAADRRQAGRGAGLGLSIVARTMAAHGGTVEVGDRPGGGAAFTLRFPRAA